MTSDDYRLLLQKEELFLGGIPTAFTKQGRDQLVRLLHHGMERSHTLMDVGCGCLRGGFWTIPFLDAGNYFGSESHAGRLETAKRILWEEDRFKQSAAWFEIDETFDLEQFGTTFDYFMACSIWTHAGRSQILRMMDQFVATSRPSSVWLGSYFKATQEAEIYRGDDWVGKSHTSDESGYVRHSLLWLTAEAAKRDLHIRDITGRPESYRDVRWLKMTHL